MKHTPAPWYFSNEGVLRVRAKDDDEVVCSYAGYENCEREYANAKLIAAAPDLLEALQALVAFYPDDVESDVNRDWGFKPELTAVVNMSRVAISKALWEE
ncbi:hypothetical protein ABKU91_20965 [Enterobacter hormaechei]